MSAVAKLIDDHKRATLIKDMIGPIDGVLVDVCLGDNHHWWRVYAIPRGPDAKETYVLAARLPLEPKPHDIAALKEAIERWKNEE